MTGSDRKSPAGWSSGVSTVLECQRRVEGVCALRIGVLGEDASASRRANVRWTELVGVAERGCDHGGAGSHQNLGSLGEEGRNALPGIGDDARATPGGL